MKKLRATDAQIKQLEHRMQERWACDVQTVTDIVSELTDAEIDLLRRAKRVRDTIKEIDDRPSLDNSPTADSL